MPGLYQNNIAIPFKRDGISPKKTMQCQTYSRARRDKFLANECHLNQKQAMHLRLSEGEQKGIAMTQFEVSNTCNEKQRSSCVAFTDFNNSGAADSIKVRRPDKEISMPLTTYGSSTNFWPFFASCSMLYPAAVNLLLMLPLQK